jgi:excisionase family DNA binding protein
VTISERGARKWVICLMWIKDRIDNGTYPEGTWLPRVDEMCSILGVSVHSVRRALFELSDRKIINQVSSIGWYVGNGEPPLEDSPAEIKRNNRGYGRRPGTPEEPALFLSEESYITCRELAAMLHVTRVTVYKIVNSGQIQGPIRVGRSLRIPVSGATKFLEEAKI